jgi:hypothetical protein
MKITLIRCRTCLAEWFDYEPDRWGNLQPGLPKCRCDQRGWTKDWQIQSDQIDGRDDA